jgi:hypothetical protein
MNHGVAVAKRLVEKAEVWQLNSPEPYGYLYFSEPNDETAYASGDHDGRLGRLSKPGRGPNN